MKQDIAVYLTDSFVDFEGKEHQIVACALSQSPETQDLKIGWVDEGIIDEDGDLYHSVYRMVTIGIAVCNPIDKYDIETGKRIARHKAENIEDLPRIYTTSKGIITSELVHAFLKQQIRFFKENPGTFIAGYDKAKERFLNRKTVESTIQTLTPEERVVFDMAVRGVDLSKYSDLAKIYLKENKHV